VSRLPSARGTGGRPPLLAHRRVYAPHARPERWVLFLHGFLGSGRNWASIGRGLVRERPEWGVVLVDLRLHGESAGFSPPHTVAACAADVNDLAMRLGCREHAVVGHSFGGKVALAASRAPGAGLRQVWVIDSTPEPGRTGAGADRLLSLLRRLPERYDDRRTAVSLLEKAGIPPDVANWVATNLERRPEGYRWRIDLGSLEFLLADFYRSDLWEAVERPPAGVDLVFVRATRGSILSAAAAGRLSRMRELGAPVRLIEIEGGHWLNASNPQALLSRLVADLPA